MEVISRREFLSIPPLLQGWFNADPLEQRITELEEGLEDTKEVLGLTLGAMLELAGIIDSNRAYLENRLDEIESRIPPPRPKEHTQV